MQPDENLAVESLKLNETQRDLAAKYMPLALTLAKDFSRGWNWLTEEMESAALMALVEAASTFRKEFNVKFPTFAKTRINGALITARNKYMQLYQKRTKAEQEKDLWLRIRAASNLDDDEMQQFEQHFGASFHLDPTEIFEIREDLDSFFKRLPAKHRNLMRAIYFEYSPIEKLQEDFQCGRERILAMHRESINMLLSDEPLPTPRKSRKRRKETRVVNPGFSDKTIPDSFQITE